jgi:hypothetical protein
MRDLLLRFSHARPKVEAWIEQLLATHSRSRCIVDTTRFSRLALFLPPTVLAAAKVVTVDRTPFPPVTSYGLPEFAAMEAASMGGITFRDTYFLSPDYALDEGTHFHELIHTIQWRALGMRDFLLTYGLGLAQFGYEGSPLEAIAYQLQGEFDANRPLLNVEGIVSLHATQARSAAQAIFRATQVPWGA